MFNKIKEKLTLSIDDKKNLTLAAFSVPFYAVAAVDHGIHTVKESMKHGVNTVEVWWKDRHGRRAWKEYQKYRNSFEGQFAEWSALMDRIDKKLPRDE